MYYPFPHARLLLMLIRDGKINNIDDIKELQYTRSDGNIWHEILYRLIDSGIIEKIPEENNKLQVTREFLKIQALLKLSISELGHSDPHNSLIVSPKFRKSGKAIKKVDVFVIMPFNDNLKPIFEDHIKPVADKLSLSVARGDDFFTNHSIIENIWESILTSKVIIADCTGKNPNVFYELGIAHTLGKEVILITQDAEDVPFDIRHLRYIKYKFTPRGMQAFEENLEVTLSEIIHHSI